MALLRPERWKSIFPMSERYDIQSGSFNVRLVVQREMFDNVAIVRIKRTIIQIHHSDEAEFPGRLFRAFGRSVFDGKI